MPNQTGKRFVCRACGSEMLVTRGGSGELSCCGQPMQPREGGAAPQGQQAPTGGQGG